MKSPIEVADAGDVLVVQHGHRFVGEVVHERDKEWLSLAQEGGRLIPVSPGWTADLAQQLADELLRWARTSPDTLDVSAVPEAVHILSAIQQAIDARRIVKS